MRTKIILLLLAVCGIATAQNTWVQKPFYGGGTRNLASGFSIGSKGYIFVGGSDTALTRDMWEYDTLTTVWTQKNDFPGTARQAAVAFAIGNKGYVGTGMDTSGLTRDFWEYDPALDTWTQKADFGGTARSHATGFSIGNKGYIGTGNDGDNQNDFYEYDPALDTWTMKAFLTGLERYGAFGFSIGNKGYIGGGNSHNDFYEYNPANNTWTQKTDLIGSSEIYATGFSINNTGYLFTGAGNLHGYNPASDTWVIYANLLQGRDQAVSFSIGNKGYMGTGGGSGRRRDFWQYTPCSALPVATISADGPLEFCQGDTLILTANAGTTYSWSGLSGFTQTLEVTESGTYAVTVSDSCGIATSAALDVTVFSSNASSDFELYPDSTQPMHYIAENNATGTAPLAYLWAWGDGTTDNTAYPIHTYDIAGTYTICLTVTDANGCSDTYCNDYAFKTASPIAYVQVIDGITGIEDNALNSFSLYPNPAANTVTVELNASVTSGESIYQLQDVTGNLVLNGSITTTKFSIDISALSKGIYLLSLFDGEQQVNRKIVKE
jgi:PKD repeat protein